MTNKINLTPNVGIELQPTGVSGIARAIVKDSEKRFDLTWDRFCRIDRTAKSVREIADPSKSIVDVGGFDGALALFLPEFTIDVIDPETTGGTGLDITENSYDIVVSIDALEHIEPALRNTFLNSTIRAARNQCFINFPSQRSAAAQSLVYELTKNPLVHDHVKWELPDAHEVAAHMNSAGFNTQIFEHTGIAQWVSQYLLQTFNADAAAKASRYLLESHIGETATTCLYDLIVGRKNAN